MKPELLPAAQSVLAGVALIIMGVLGLCLIFNPVPQGNQQLLTFVLGAISGALTVAGGQKMLASLTHSPSPAIPPPEA